MIILLYIGHTQSTRYRLDSYVKTPQEYKTALIYHSENWVITNLSTSTSFNTLQQKRWRKGKLPSSHFVCLFYLPPALVTKAHIISAKYAALPKQSIAATLPWNATKVCSSSLLPPFLTSRLPVWETKVLILLWSDSDQKATTDLVLPKPQLLHLIKQISHPEEAILNEERTTEDERRWEKKMPKQKVVRSVKTDFSQIHIGS